MKKDNIKRRDFIFYILGSGSFIAANLGFIISSIRFLFPNVLYEPQRTFKIGKANDFPPDSITFLEDKKIFVFNKADGFYFISGVCTHLGCTVKLHGNQFDCPCHGSKFDINGNVISGPAPKPLPWFSGFLSPSGQLVVDMSTLVKPDFRLKL